MPDESILCAAWRSDAMPETYLMVKNEQGLDELPEELLSRFKNPQLVTTFKLSASRKLANANAEDVLRSIAERGYYLQLPPPRDFDMSAVAARNEKMAR